MILQAKYGSVGFWEQDALFYDWIRLAGSQESAYRFLNDWLSGAGAQQLLSPSGEQAAWIESAYFQYRQSEKLRADRNLYIGYPFAVARRGDTLYAAPLFLWPCRLEPSRESAAGWEISIAESEPPMAHPFWLNTILNPGDTQENHPLQAALREGVRPAVLSKLAQTLGQLPQWEVNDTQAALAPLLQPEEVCPEDGHAKLIWSAACGILSADLLLQQTPAAVNWRETAPAGSLPDHAYSHLPLDPYQAQAMAALRVQKHVLAHGSGGAGKTHLGAHLVANALSNGRSCLVLANDLAALESYRQHLAAVGLDGALFGLRSPQLDRQLLLTQLTAMERRTARQSDYNRQEFGLTVRRLQRLQERLDARYQAVRKRAFGGSSWSDTVGLYLAAAKKQNKDQLASQLNPQHFDYTESEYQTIRTAITQARPLFEALGIMQHPLSVLNAGIFLHQDMAQSLAFIESTSASFKEDALRLYNQLIRRSGQYTDELQQRHERHYRELLQHLHGLEELLEDSAGEVGEELLRSSKPTLKLYGAFSEKFREALNRQEQLQLGFEQLKQLHTQRGAFAFEWPADARAVRKPESMRELLKRFSESLDQWRNGLPAGIQDDAHRLNARTVLPELASGKYIAEAEQKLENLIDAINESGLFQLPLEAKMATMPRRQKFLEELADKLDNILRNLDNYEAFYYWQRHWFTLPDKCRKIIHALGRLPTSEWAIAFDSWYFFHCLNTTYDPVPPPPSDAVERYAQNWESLKAVLPAQTRKDREQSRDEALKRLKGIHKEPAPARWQDDAGWPELLARHGADLTQAFPIWVTTPALAQRLMSRSPELFDYLIIENAHQLSPETGTACLGLARQCLLLADSGQENLLPTSLVKEARRNGIASVYLNGLHRRAAGDVAGITRGMIVPEEDSGIRYTQVDGRYNPAIDSNEAEAQEVVRLLNQIEETPQRTYPCVGVVTFTRGQRDLILSYLLRIKRQRLAGVELIQQLERNGLGVYCLDEIGGQTFDLLLVSGAYGPINLSGELPRAIEGFETPRHQALLMGLLGAYRRELHIISSLSAQALANLLAVGHGGLPLLAGFFQYAAAGGNADEARSVLAQLRKIINNGLGAHGASSPLLDEIVSRLESYFPGVSLATAAKWNGINAPLLLTASQQKPVIALADGFVAEGSTTDYYWEWQYIQKVRALGAAVQSVSSQDWWKNPTAETVRLAGAIRGLMAGVPEEEEE